MIHRTTSDTLYDINLSINDIQTYHISYLQLNMIISCAAPCKMYLRCVCACACNYICAICVSHVEILVMFLLFGYQTAGWTTPGCWQRHCSMVTLKCFEANSIRFLANSASRLVKDNDSLHFPPHSSWATPFGYCCFPARLSEGVGISLEMGNLVRFFVRNTLPMILHRYRAPIILSYSCIISWRIGS